MVKPATRGAWNTSVRPGLRIFSQALRFVAVFRAFRVADVRRIAPGRTGSFATGGAKKDNVVNDPGNPSQAPAGSGSGGLHRYAGYGFAWAGAALLGGWAGLELDQRLGTVPLFALLGAFGGAGAGLYTLYVRLVVEPAAKEKAEQE